MQAEKKTKVVPKPQGLKKKQERNQNYAAKLAKERDERRQKNKAKREAITKKAQEYEEKYTAETKGEIAARRAAKLANQIYVPAEAKLAFVIRIRGVNKLGPKVVRILRILRLRQLHNGAFMRINKASINMLRRVEPFVTYGYPTRQTIKKLIYQRGFGKSNKQRIPLSNPLIEKELGKHGIVCVQDLVNEIYTVGPHFREANNFLWSFKLRAPRGGFAQKRHPFQRRGDWGNREAYINNLVNSML